MFRRIENILMQARAHREANVGANVDALIDCLASPETAGAFQSLLPGVLGFAPLNYANGYASWMEREHPWVLRLLESLPPARLVPAVSGGLSGYLLDPFRPFFHEPSLVAFLNGPYGDLRQLEGSTPLDHSRIDLGINIKDVMMGGTSEARKATRTLRRKLAELKKETPPAEPIVSEVLGAELKAGELEEFGVMGSLLERSAREARPQVRKPHRSAFAAYYLR